jgi:hypothetical protein
MARNEWDGNAAAGRTASCPETRFICKWLRYKHVRKLSLRVLLRVLRVPFPSRPLCLRAPFKEPLFLAISARHRGRSPKPPTVTLISASAKLQCMQRQAQHGKKEIDVTGLPEEAIRAVQCVVSLLRAQPANKPATAEKPTDELLGLFRDESELLDQIVQEAMKARETQPLRLPRE